MNGTSEARTPHAGAGQATAPLAFAGPVGLIAGENAGSYDELLARVTATLKPADIMEEIWVRDMVDLVWETLRLKASLLAACAGEGVYHVLDALNSDLHFETSSAWLARDPTAVEQVEAALESAGMSMDAVMAPTLSARMGDIVHIDRMTMAAEARRSAVLREIERYRAGFAQRLRGAVGAETIALLPAGRSRAGGRIMSAARLAANRANAQKSTGPRTAAGKLRAAQNARQSTGPTTAAGKKRSAQNARRHGLNVLACHDPAVAGGIEHLSCAIASCAIAAANEDPQVIALAQRVAAAQVDLMRARRARLELLGAKPLENIIRRLAAIERYERRARAQRAVAIRAFDYARAVAVAQSRNAELAKRTEPNVTKRTEPNVSP
jgi:hypothetical protein